MKRLQQKGFTIIELLVVIAIIGVLVTIVIIAIDPVRLIENARDSRARSDMQQIKASMQLFYNDCKVYPPTLPSGVWDGSDYSGSCDDGTTYMKQVPTNGGTAFSYAVSPAACTTDCTSYVVGTHLNRTNTDDANTLTQCSSPTLTSTPAINYKVCND